MGESYRGMGTATGKSSGVSAMPQHCESLTKSLNQEAAEYEAMARVHRDLAKAAKQSFPKLRRRGAVRSAAPGFYGSRA
jgi:hypothetical protein